MKTSSQKKLKGYLDANQHSYIIGIVSLITIITCGMFIIYQAINQDYFKFDSLPPAIIAVISSIIYLISRFLDYKNINTIRPAKPRPANTTEFNTVNYSGIMPVATFPRDDKEVRNGAFFSPYSDVELYFFCILKLPIFPVEAIYRSLGHSTYHSYKKDIESFKLYGADEMYGLEILQVYLTYYGFYGLVISNLWFYISIF